ncbi:hypothetical protein (plasmid) [Metabacillus dongyingensis]|nr:hypothetical protein [Metabacillus dongyingensis]
MSIHIQCAASIISIIENNEKESDFFIHSSNGAINEELREPR